MLWTTVLLVIILGADKKAIDGKAELTVGLLLSNDSEVPFALLLQLTPTILLPGKGLLSKLSEVQFVLTVGERMLLVCYLLPLLKQLLRQEVVRDVGRQNLLEKSGLLSTPPLFAIVIFLGIT